MMGSTRESGLRQRVPLEERLRRRLKLNPETGCIEWMGPTLNGYGRIGLGGSTTLGAKTDAAHRIAYELARGKIPAGLVLDHLCRNRRCCNPEHLEPVTLAENNLRGVGAPALNARRTHCVRGHPFYGANLRLTGRGIRVCKRCRADAAAAALRARLAARTPMERAVARMRQIYKLAQFVPVSSGVAIVRLRKPDLLLTYEAARRFAHEIEEAQA